MLARLSSCVHALIGDGDFDAIPRASKKIRVATGLRANKGTESPAESSFAKGGREWATVSLASEWPMAAKITPQHEARANPRVVLLAEDEPLIRFDIADELRRLGYQVIEAGNADEAIEVLQSTARLDLVLTDVRMPGSRDGLDVARAVREKRPGVGIIVMSGHLVPKEKHEDIMDLFVSKPVPGDQLAKAIVEFMNSDAAKRGQ